jgi:hypothetical protein
MSLIKIQEAKNGAAQLSQGKYFLMVNKFRINKGSNVGKAIIVVKMSHLETSKAKPEENVFVEDKSFLLTPKEFGIWIALLIQVDNRPLNAIKDGEPNDKQKKL